MIYRMMTRYLNSAAAFSPPDDPRAAAQAQRDSIEVNDSVKSQDEVDATENADADDTENNDENNEDEEESSDEDEEENEDETEGNEEQETKEQKDARLAKEKEKNDKKSARVQRKFDKLAAEKTAAENRVKELEAQLKEVPKEGLSEEEVNRRAEDLASQKLTAKEKADAQKAFEETCDRIEAAALKANKEFGKNVSEMVEEIGPVPAPLINILDDLDHKNGGAVLAYLSENVDEAEDIYKLSPTRMSLKLVRISDKLKEASKKLEKRHSNVTPPITPVDGGRRPITNTLTGKEDMDTFVAKRNAMEADRRKQRGY